MKLKLTNQEARDAIPSIKRYILEEFEEEIGDLKAEMLLDFFLTEIGPYAYNRGVSDAEQYYREKTEDLAGVCHHSPLNYWTKKRR
ncbi:DUF2164 domain-containing protein [Coraliomargarita sp. W4R53]